MEYFNGAHTNAMDTSTQCWYTRLMQHRESSNKPTRWRSSFEKNNNIEYSVLGIIKVKVECPVTSHRTAPKKTRLYVLKNVDITQVFS